ncbi:MAG TPA: hypothetical protein VK694_01255 [Verrucomicrobiae bacterium]|nr:hypothetical protein [Verrucomicrobiae bacterium]
MNTDSAPQPDMSHQPAPQESLGNPELSPDEIVLELQKRLPEWANELVNSERYENPDDPHRDQFAENPNATEMHSKWHQWGIIRHTLMTGKYLDDIVPGLLESEEWFGPDTGGSKLGLADESIDSMSKWDLLRIAAPTHDYGKFAKRQYRGDDADGNPMFTFAGHEAESGNIVRAWKDRFAKFGMTEDQIEYVAQCAQLHYELGKLRDKAKDSELGYTIAFTESEEFEDMAQEIASLYPDMVREMGIFFVADSLAKNDLHQTIRAQTDEEIEQARAEIQQDIANRNLAPHLLVAGMQQGINMAAGRKFLKIAA